MKLSQQTDKSNVGGRRLLLYVAVFSLVMTGCQFVDLRRDLQKMEKFTFIEGTVVQDKPTGSPVGVALFSDALERQNLLNAKLIDGRTFRFGVPPGKYFIFAFEDKNRDFNYQPSEEQAGFFGEPSPILLGKDASRTNIVIRLQRNLVIPNKQKPDNAPNRTTEQRFPKLWKGRKNIGALAFLEDKRFDESVAKKGLWEPLRFSLEVGPGLFLLEPYDYRKMPILFVHGIGGSPRSWGPIINHLDSSRFQPWVFHYASGLPLHANASYLFEAVTQLRLQHHVQKMYLVAHSMGGLVSQAFINRHPAGSADYLKLFVTLATPWGGHSAASMGVKYSPAVIPVLRDMDPASKFLKRLREKQLPSHLPHHLLFAYKGSEFKSSGANDGVVTVSSQREPTALGRAKKVYGFSSGHREILSNKKVLRLLAGIFEPAD
jgi:pimeloyl-ACP methyl ester carboxylesterase